MKTFQVTIEHTVVTRQVVTVQAKTKHDASFAARDALKDSAWDEIAENDRVISVETAY